MPDRSIYRRYGGGVEALMTKQEQLSFLINDLAPGLVLPQTEEEKFRLFRSLVNIREPKPVSSEFLQVQDAFLKDEIASGGITDMDALAPVKDHIYLWKGDITRLRADAVVNAANSGMLGCFCPCHGCIDNCIHTYSGVQLRLACAEIMEKQGYPEPVGRAKITRAYNLPCRYILHTVGPRIVGRVTDSDCEMLASCYRSCMELANENKLQSIAFCCISTGEFRFPNELAAQIAVKTVKETLSGCKQVKKVLFNVFKDVDLQIYKKLI